MDQVSGPSYPWRAILSLAGALIFGPLIGGLAALAGFMGTGILTDFPPSSDGAPMPLRLLILFYAIGLGPALAAGLVFAGIVWRHGTISYRKTALISLAGGVAAIMLMNGFRLPIISRLAIETSLISLAAALIAALACRALFGRFGLLLPDKP